MILCPCCSRHIRLSQRCPFCALVLATVCAVAVASCGESTRRPPAVYGGPPDEPASRWTTKLPHDTEGLVAAFTEKGIKHGCQVTSRRTDEVLLSCPEGVIGLVKRELDVTIACQSLARAQCGALFQAIADEKE